MEQLPPEIVDTLCSYLDRARDVVAIATTSTTMMSLVLEGVRIKHFTVVTKAFSTRMKPVFRCLRTTADAYSPELADNLLALKITYSTYPTAKKLIVPEGVKQLEVEVCIDTYLGFTDSPDEIVCPSTLTRLFASGAYVANITGIPQNMEHVQVENPFMLVTERTYTTIMLQTVLMHGLDFSKTFVATDGIYNVFGTGEITVPKTTNLVLLPLDRDLPYKPIPDIVVPHAPEKFSTTYSLINWVEIKDVSLANPLMCLIMVSDTDEQPLQMCIKLDSYLSQTDVPLLGPLASCLNINIDAIMDRFLETVVLPPAREIELFYEGTKPLLVKYEPSCLTSAPVLTDIQHIHLPVIGVVILLPNATGVKNNA